MADYPGQVVFRGMDEFGDLVVADTVLTRSLYFGKTAVQSSLFHDFPEDLALHYSRAMMSVLMFCRRPEQLLLIGLGGASIVRFLLRACPDCRISVVEIRQGVIRIAQQFFGLAVDHPNLNIICGDGRQYILDRQGGADGRYDLLLVDVYDEASRMDAVADLKFMAAARSCLSKDGIVAFNLWTGSSGNFPLCRDRLNRVFAGACRSLILDADRGNAILLGFNNPAMLEDVARFRPVAQALCAEFFINFQAFLEVIMPQGE